MSLSKSVAAWALALSFAMGAQAQDAMQIQYAESVEIAATPGETQFDAYGRRFSLVLETNDRLLKGMPAARKAALGTIRLLRGTLAGVPNSWVRLTSDGSQIAGAIWDGTDVYVIARRDQVASHLTSPLAVGDLQTVVYRLSDTSNLLPANFCAVQPASTTGAAPANGLTQFKGLVDELKLSFVAAPTDELDISLIADASLQQIYSSPNDNLTVAMLNTLNVVDGIYDAQLGLLINATDLRLAPIAADPFTSTEASTLLGQLKAFRSSIPEVQSKAVAHLFTGRQLDGGTLGTAKIGGACSAADGVSLTGVGFSGLQSASALIMAHEIGHNLGAAHDTASCGDTFLMWPEMSWHTTPVFSQCSLDQMRPFIAAHRGSCIVSPLWGDVSVRVGAIANPLRTEPFVWPVYVRSDGTAPLLDAFVNIQLGGVTINSAAPSQGTCAPSNGYLQCRFGNIPAGVEARVDLDLTANYIGPLTMHAYADASNDRYDTNNQASGNIDVQPQAKLGMTITPSTAAALVGVTVPYTVTINSTGVRDARNVTLSLYGGSYAQITSADATQGTCDNYSCTLGDIPAGSSAQVTIHVRATQGGLHTASVQISSGNALVNPQYLNATLDATATFDLAIDAGPAYRTLAAGVPYEFVIPVRANGTRPVVGGLFRMNTGGGTFLSADIDGTSCAREELVVAQGGGCPLGTLNPGEQKIVRVRLQFNEARDTSVYATAEILNDELWTNNSAYLTLNVRVVTDVSIGASPYYAGDTERRNFQAIATLRSQGANDAANVSATFDVPVGVRILSATLPQGACTLTGDRRVTCTRPTLALNEQPQMTVTLVGDEPAQYTGTFAVTADNDGVPSNNSAPVAINVGPLTDVTLNPIPTLPGFIVGQPREFTVEVLANLTRPAENVIVSFPWSQGFVLEAISTTVGTCDVSGTSPHCNLGTLPPNSLVRLTPRYRAVTAGWGMSGSISVQANRDVDQSNNSRHVNMNTYEAGDIEIRVGSAISSGTAGSTLVLPSITLNTITRSQDVHVYVSIPAFATVESISFAAGICTGTTSLECYMFERATGSSDVLEVTLRLNSTGTFTSDLRVTAGNDTNAANDNATLQIRANAASGSSSGSSSSGGSAGGGGGGGRIEWGLLAALGLIAARRARRRVAFHA